VTGERPFDSSPNKVSSRHYYCIRQSFSAFPRLVLITVLNNLGPKHILMLGRFDSSSAHLRTYISSLSPPPTYYLSIQTQACARKYESCRGQMFTLGKWSNSLGIVAN
jgi:hypothetical protein